MAAIDETELRFVLEGLNKEQLTSILENNGYSYKGKDDFLIRQLTSILENNGYSYKGKDDFLIRQIMTKISYSVIIEELEAMGVI